jgi:hypothetical protein
MKKSSVEGNAAICNQGAIDKPSEGLRCVEWLQVRASLCEEQHEQRRRMKKINARRKASKGSDTEYASQLTLIFPIAKHDTVNLVAAG